MNEVLAVVSDFFTNILGIIQQFFDFIAGLFNFGGDADPTDPEDPSAVA